MTFAHEAGEKFAALVVRRNGLLDQPLDAYLRQSESRPADTREHFALARWLALRDVARVSVRTVWVNAVTTAYLILYGDDVVEVITHTGYFRTVQKRWNYVGGVSLDGGRDGERFGAAMKFKKPKRVGGGLMRGPASPRTKKFAVISTHALRRAEN